MKRSKRLDAVARWGHRVELDTANAVVLVAELLLSHSLSGPSNNRAGIGIDLTETPQVTRAAWRTVPGWRRHRSDRDGLAALRNKESSVEHQEGFDFAPLVRHIAPFNTHSSPTMHIQCRCAFIPSEWRTPTPKTPGSARRREIPRRLRLYTEHETFRRLSVGLYPPTHSMSACLTINKSVRRRSRRSVNISDCRQVAAANSEATCTHDTFRQHGYSIESTQRRRQQVRMYGHSRPVHVGTTPLYEPLVVPSS